MDTSRILGIASELNELNESIEKLRAIVEQSRDVYLRVSNGSLEDVIDYDDYPYIKEELDTIFSKVLNERLKRRESLRQEIMNENLWRD